MAKYQIEGLKNVLKTAEGIEAINNYTLHSQIILAGLFDLDFTLISANHKMSSTFHLSHRSNVKLVDIFFIQTDHEIYATNSSSVSVPHLLKFRQNEEQYFCYFIQLKNTILMLAEAVTLSDEKLIESMTFMSMDLSNLMRNLREKNNALNAANDKIQKLINLDPLTGLYNRRYFNEHLKLEFARAIRYKESFSLIMCDLDYFKTVNDTYGHEGGDKILVFFSDLLKKYTRKVDMCVRFGGDEFLILMPHISLSEAVKTSERIHQKYINSDPFQDGFKMSASFGVATYSNEETTQLLLKHADNALYRAKEKGRNCVST